MMITKENYDLLRELNQKFEDKVDQVLTLKAQLETGKSSYNGYIVNIEYGSEKIEVKTEIPSNCSCCSDDYDYYEFPVSYLFDENWQEDVKQKIKEKQEREERIRIEKEEKRKKETEERERKEFERLQQKFGN